MRRLLVLALTASALSGCQSSADAPSQDAGEAPQQRAPVATQPAPAAPTTPAPEPAATGIPFSEYVSAFQVKACYERATDAAEDPLGKSVSCDLPRAGFRLVNLGPDQSVCGIDQAFVVVPARNVPEMPTLCLEAVSR